MNRKTALEAEAARGQAVRAQSFDVFVAKVRRIQCEQAGRPCGRAQRRSGVQQLGFIFEPFDKFMKRPEMMNESEMPESK